MMDDIEARAREATFCTSSETPNSAVVRGVDFNTLVDIDQLATQMYTTGFQATNVGLAIQEINKMINWRLSDWPVSETDAEQMRDPAYRREQKCTIFLSYTSNMISSGVRETIKFLVQHKFVDVVITTAGGIEEDIIKCFADFYLGDFALPGKELKAKGINRTGNLLVPNDNYIGFEDFMTPFLEDLTEEQVTQGTRWTPSKFINRLGKAINDERSVYYWAWKNDIPVFSPALTDGSLGDMIFFHMLSHPEFVLDIAEDVLRINTIALSSPCSGMIILGGGLVKHHACNTNMMRGGANFSVYINTGQEFDGSDAGARPDEAVSWGKIRTDATPVKVYCDATLVFPLIVHQTFYKEHLRRQAANAHGTKKLEPTAA